MKFEIGFPPRASFPVAGYDCTGQGAFLFKTWKLDPVSDLGQIKGKLKSINLLPYSLNNYDTFQIHF